MRSSLILAFLLLAVGSNAQLTDHHHGGALEPRQHGYQHGYRDGYHHAREDRQRGVSYGYKTADYKNGDRDYESYMGSRGLFQKGYRDGYKEGYDDGFYGRIQRLPQVFPADAGPFFGRQDPVTGRVFQEDDDSDYARRGWGYRDVAFDIGFRYGVQAGADDARGGKPPDPNQHSEYRAADHGYYAGYGAKEPYREQFRAGFQQGYQDAR